MPLSRAHDQRVTQDVFAALRPRLLGVAYGIVGELAEAEDVVQDTWLRWGTADRDAVRDPTAFLICTESPEPRCAPNTL
jgi:RNA polymerase sigma-70 factor (ECF subfamily)